MVGIYLCVYMFFSYIYMYIYVISKDQVRRKTLKINVYISKIILLRAKTWILGELDLLKLKHKWFSVLPFQRIMLQLFMSDILPKTRKLFIMWRKTVFCLTYPVSRRCHQKEKPHTSHSRSFALSSRKHILKMAFCLPLFEQQV